MKEVIILGTGGTAVECPFDKETWGINLAYKTAKRLDKLFMADPPDMSNHEELEEARHKFGMEIVTREPFPIETTIYPKKEVVEWAGKDYLMPTASFVLAYALFKGYKRIWTYGIDCLDDGYAHQLPCMNWWCGFAHGRGIEVYSPDASAMARERGMYVAKYKSYYAQGGLVPCQ